MKWPTMPPNKGQSPILFEDGYAEGWAKCLEQCQQAYADRCGYELGFAAKQELASLTDEQIEAIWLSTFETPLPLPDKSMMRAELRRRIFARAILAAAREALLRGMSDNKVDEQLLYSTDDASVWAKEFAKVRPDVDEGLMITWFASCAESAKGPQALRADGLGRRAAARRTARPEQAMTTHDPILEKT